MKKILLMIILGNATVYLSGCMTDKPETAFNPEAVYRVPAGGLWINGLIDDATGAKQGLMFVWPATFLICEGSEIK